jgi:hypothetical protein
MPHPYIVCTYIPTYLRYIHTPYLQTYITFRSVYFLLLPPLSRPVPPHPRPPVPLWSSAAHRIVYSWVGKYVCKPGCVTAYMYAVGRSRSIFALSSSLTLPDRPRHCFQIYHLMDLCSGNALRMPFYRLGKKETKFADLIVEEAFDSISHYIHHSYPRNLIPCHICSLLILHASLR